MVRRCSPFRMEARAGSTSKEYFHLTLRATQDVKSGASEEGCCSPHEGLRFVSIWGCPQTALRQIIRSLTEPKGSNSKFKPRGLNKR